MSEIVENTALGAAAATAAKKTTRKPSVKKAPTPTPTDLSVVSEAIEKEVAALSIPNELVPDTLQLKAADGQVYEVEMTSDLRQQILSGFTQEIKALIEDARASTLPAVPAVAPQAVPAPAAPAAAASPEITPVTPTAPVKASGKVIAVEGTFKVAGLVLASIGAGILGTLGYQAYQNEQRTIDAV